MAREPSVRPKDLKNTVNHSFTFYILGSPYNAIHGNLKCNFNKHLQTLPKHSCSHKHIISTIFLEILVVSREK